MGRCSGVSLVAPQATASAAPQGGHFGGDAASGAAAATMLRCGPPVSPTSPPFPPRCSPIWRSGQAAICRFGVSAGPKQGHIWCVCRPAICRFGVSAARLGCGKSRFSGRSGCGKSRRGSRLPAPPIPAGALPSPPWPRPPQRSGRCPPPPRCCFACPPDGVVGGEGASSPPWSLLRPASPPLGGVADMGGEPSTAAARSRHRRTSAPPHRCRPLARAGREHQERGSAFGLASGFPNAVFCRDSRRRIDTFCRDSLGGWGAGAGRRRFGGRSG